VRPTLSAHDLALRAFWTERPLCAAYAAATGAASFSLRQLIRFAESLPGPALADVIAVEAYRDALPAHRQSWFGSLGFEDQRRLAGGAGQ
jgi:hypothetical protein